MSPFLVRDCSLALIATGIEAASLIELRDTIGHVPESSLYYHFWRSRLRSSFIHPEYPNDFAHWAHFALHDNILSERFGILDPTAFSDLEELRKVMIDIIEERLDEVEFILWSKKEEKYHFLRSLLIIYDTKMIVDKPEDLKKVVPNLLPTSIFFHFIDARRRTPTKTDDFSFWLSGFKEEHAELIQKIQHIDPYFCSLSEAKLKLIETFNEYFI
jgi:hypothetical protein